MRKILLEYCNKILENAPLITDNLCPDCKQDFENVKSALDKLNINYKVDKKIVRGLDYYNKTVYEWTSKDLDLAVGGGGRYDGLVEILGGQSCPAVGFGIGMDRLVLLLTQYNLPKDIDNDIKLFIATTNESGYIEATKLSEILKDNKIVVDINITNKSLKSQTKYADKNNMNFIAFFGEDELNNNKIRIKNMKNANQVDFDISDLDGILKFIKEGNESNA